MKKLLLALLASTAINAPVQAAPFSDNEGHFLIRGRAVVVSPDEKSSIDPIGGDVSISTTIVPEIDASYFFTNNIAVELIAAITPHNITAKNTSLGDVDVGKAWLLPPTLTLQYHFTSLDTVKPYVGVGVNYTHFFNTDPGALSNVEYDDSFGPALQAGIDVPITDKWFFNADIKKLWINTTASFNNGGVKADVDIDPWLFGVGFGYRF